MERDLVEAEASPRNPAGFRARQNHVLISRRLKEPKHRHTHSWGGSLSKALLTAWPSVYNASRHSVTTYDPTLHTKTAVASKPAQQSQEIVRIVNL
jgi:hypothetical protein